MKTKACAVFVLLLVSGAYFFGGGGLLSCGNAAETDTVLLQLVYPQPRHAPKRARTRLEPPVTVKGEVYVDVEGLKPEQRSNPDIYIEYFLDTTSIYLFSGQEGGQERPTGFVFDTSVFCDGKHQLTANVTDKDKKEEPAIGIREIIIKNNAAIP